ncbi:MAG: LysR family transcriptional regulator [Oscillospiraceae bacterium]|nr:LysR family transcriptional regulator [Oscillospiraceae bacterium]
MDILQLQYFQTIARLENISKASEILYVAQPNLSTSLKRLEEELGVSLFDRRKGKIKLTPTGRLFLGYVDSILGQLDQAVTTLRETERQANEQVRVASVIVDLMGSLLDDFLSRHPGVCFRQLHCRNDEVVERVLNGSADFGFVFGIPPLQGLEYMEFDRCERVVQLAKSHPLAEKGLVSLKDLDGQPLICNLSRDDGELIEELTHAGKLRPDQRFFCDDNRVEVSMALHGGGLSIAPLSNYLKLLHREPGLELTCLRIREELPPARLGLIRRDGVRLSQAALQFYEIVARFFLQERELADAFSSTLPARA